jgi:hypothetical protein
MGGVSDATATQETLQGCRAARLTGEVSLENNGGFVQMGFDLAGAGGTTTPSDHAGIAIDVLGNGERYDLRIRTEDLTRPWQSYRVGFKAPAEWTTYLFPFEDFAPYRTDLCFEPNRLRRIGVVAAGRAFCADVAVARIGFFA